MVTKPGAFVYFCFVKVMYIGDLPACTSVCYALEVPLGVDSLELALQMVRNLRVDARKQPRVLWNVS